MHVPATVTSALAIEPFDTAYEEALRPQADYDSSRWLYVPCRYTEYRYILGTRGRKPLICIGINPSTAAPDHLDNTLKSTERIALANGYDSFVMFNLYAQRATDPDDMEKQFNAALHRENVRAFAYVLDHIPIRTVWAAWGTIIRKRSFLYGCLDGFLKEAETRNVSWYTAGKRSRDGHPHHPLYLPRGSLLEPFDVLAYRESLENSR